MLDAIIGVLERNGWYMRDGQVGNKMSLGLLSFSGELVLGALKIAVIEHWKTRPTP